MAGAMEAQGGDDSAANGPKAAHEEERITFLGRPALVVTLGTGGGAGAGERSQKRARPEEGGDEGAQGGIRQVARSMLRAHKLGVLVPLVYHTDVESGRAVLEAVPGRPLQALMQAAVAEAEAGSAGAEAAEAGGSGKAAADLDAAAVALGKALARLHDGDQVHGGLGGSSVLLRDSDGAVVLTDFRRSTNSLIAIDKASDLAALERALLEAAAAGRGGQEAAASTSAAAAGAESGGDGAKAAAAAPSKATEIASAFFEKVLNTYRPSSRMWSAVHNKLAEVRGRKAVSQPGQAAAAAGSGSKAAAANKKSKTEAAK